MIKFLFVGLGSIGKRHLQNVTDELTACGIAYSVDVLRRTDIPLEEGIAKRIETVYRSFSKINTEYDAIFITNPSSLHYETLKEAVGFARAIFIEKPVFTNPNADLAALALRQDGIYYVACPLRRSPVLRRAKELLRGGNPASARAICSSYLPEWRSGADYRLSYSADGRMGGGVRLDIIHEWDYLASFFGIPKMVKSFSGHVSALEINSEDVALYIARYSDMLLSLQLDYTGRLPRRELELYFDDETVVCDIKNNEVRYLKSGETETFCLVDIHRAETNYFLDLITGIETENINPPEQALEIVKLALK